MNKQLHQKPSLTSLTSDVAVLIFGQFRSFSDVLALAATCGSLRAVWLDNTTSIFRRVAPHDIKYLDLARSLLAAQGGTPSESGVLFSNDVRRMTRNACKADKSADRFGREVAEKTIDFVDCTYKHLPPHFGPQHPPYLTSTERPRFMRAYYRVWRLLELDDSARQRCYKQWTLRQLYRTCEMAGLRQPFGEEIGPDLNDPIGYKIPLRRTELHWEILEFADQLHLRIHGNVRMQPFEGLGAGALTNFVGYANFVTLFDHFQYDFAGSVILDVRRGSTPRDYKEYMRDEVWGESSDEELYWPRWPRRKPAVKSS